MASHANESLALYTSKFSRSRTGCSQCRERHIKCDEHFRPGCETCRQAGITCAGRREPAPRKQRKPISRFKIIPHAPKASSRPTSESSIPHGEASYADVRSSHESATATQVAFTDAGGIRDDEQETALQCFVADVLPGLSALSPNFELWRISTLFPMAQEQCIRNVMIAIGLFHRAAVARGPDETSDNQPRLKDNSASFTSSDYYYKQSLQDVQVLVQDSNLEHDRQVTVIVACFFLFMVMSFRSRNEEATIHRFSGLRLINEQRGDGSVHSKRLTREIRLLFWNLNTSAWPLRPNVENVRLLRSEISQEPDLDSLSKLDKLRASVDLLAIESLSFGASVTIGRFAKDHAAGIEQRDCLLNKLESFAQALPTTINSSFKKPPQLESSYWHELVNVVLSIAKARVLYTQIFTQCVLSRYQTTYDNYHETFKQVVDLVEQALGSERRLKRSAQQRHYYTIQLNAISTLSFVSLLCRHYVTRRRALDLLLQCPHREGLSDARLAHDVLTRVVEIEQCGLQADADHDLSNTFIPEENRVHLIYVPIDSETQESRIDLRLVLRPDGDAGYEERPLQFDLPEVDFTN